MYRGRCWLGGNSNSEYRGNFIVSSRLSCERCASWLCRAPAATSQIFWVPTIQAPCIRSRLHYRKQPLCQWQLQHRLCLNQFILGEENHSIYQERKVKVSRKAPVNKIKLSVPKQQSESLPRCLQGLRHSQLCSFGASVGSRVSRTVKSLTVLSERHSTNDIFSSSIVDQIVGNTTVIAVAALE